MPRYVAVVGPGAGASASDCALAREVGRLVALRGAILLTGGLGGVMAAAAEGVSSAGGLSVGLLPGLDRAAGNGSSVQIPTGLGEMRNALLVRAADGVIAVGGSWGTLSEIALAKRAELPVVGLGSWSIVDAAGTPVPVDTAATPEEAVDRILG